MPQFINFHENKHVNPHMDGNNFMRIFKLQKLIFSYKFTMIKNSLEFIQSFGWALNIPGNIDRFFADFFLLIFLGIFTDSLVLTTTVCLFKVLMELN
jgi:hypothetical protein